MYYQLHYLNFSIGEVPKPSYMSILTDTIVGFNLVNLDYHQLVAEHQPNLVLIFFAYLKGLGDVYLFNISGEDCGKESEQGKGGIYFTTIITYKTPFVVNVNLVTFSLALGEGVAYKTIFSWPLLKTIKDSIMTKNNSLVS